MPFLPPNQQRQSTEMEAVSKMPVHFWLCMIETCNLIISFFMLCTTIVITLRPGGMWSHRVCISLCVCFNNRVNTHTHLFNGLSSRTTWVSWYQKSKTSLDLNEARHSGVLVWSGIRWTICRTSLQTDNHTNTSSLNFYRPDALPDTQPIVSENWRQLPKLVLFC